MSRPKHERDVTDAALKVLRRAAQDPEGLVTSGRLGGHSWASCLARLQRQGYVTVSTPCRITHEGREVAS